MDDLSRYKAYSISKDLYDYEDEFIKEYNKELIEKIEHMRMEGLTNISCIYNQALDDVKALLGYKDA